MQADWIHRFFLSGLYFLETILNKSDRSLRTDPSLQGELGLGGAEGVTPANSLEPGSLSRQDQTIETGDTEGNR